MSLARRLFPFALLTALAAVLPLPAAHACVCPRIAGARPASGARDVPRNARIFWIDGTSFDSGAPGAVTLLGPDGPVTATVVKRAALGPGVALHVLTPQQPLQGGASYSLQVRGRGEPVTTFVTGAVLDETPPAPPVERRRSASAGRLGDSDCGDSFRVVEASVEATADLLAVHITATDTPPPPPLGPLDLAPAGPPYFTLLASATATADVAIGVGACMVWPATVEEGWLWYGAIDAAAGFSGWTRAGQVRLPPLPTDAATKDADAIDAHATEPDAPRELGPYRPSACAFAGHASHPSPAWLWVASLGLAMLAFRRRAR